MTDPERVEKIRQAIMRYRELLDVAQKYQAIGERDYAALFKDVPEAQRQTLATKALQREAALLHIADLDPMRRSIAQMQFYMRDLERSFEELYNNIAVDPDEE